MLFHTDREVTAVYCTHRSGITTSYGPTSKTWLIILHSSINHHPHLLDTSGRRYTGDYTFTRSGAIIPQAARRPRWSHTKCGRYIWLCGTGEQRETKMSTCWVFWQWSSRNVSGPQNYREESPVTSEPENVGRRPCWFVILPSVLTKLEPLQNEVVFMFWHFHVDANRSRHGGCSGRPDVALGARLRD